MDHTFSKKEPIKNIVFDFGGVLLDIDFTLTYEAMSLILGKEFYPKMMTESMKTHLLDFEKGLTTKETFIWNIQRYAANETPHGYDVIKAWNKMLLGWQPAKFQFLLNLRQNYKVFLLSNTNELHIEWVMKDLKKNHSIVEFDNVYFDKIYYSHLLNMRKPDKDIFEYVLNDAQIIASETLFVDDLMVNIEAAKDLNYQVYHHNPHDDLIKCIEKILQD